MATTRGTLHVTRTTRPPRRRPRRLDRLLHQALRHSTGQATALDHLGVEVESTDQVNQASTRLTGQGLDTLTEDDTTCCYAVQDKVWVHAPGNEPWEVYTVKADSPTYGTDNPALSTACCTTGATPA